jgi:hypothetical protein
VARPRVGKTTSRQEGQNYGQLIYPLPPPHQHSMLHDNGPQLIGGIKGLCGWEMRDTGLHLRPIFYSTILLRLIFYSTCSCNLLRPTIFYTTYTCTLLRPTIFCSTYAHTHHILLYIYVYSTETHHILLYIYLL